MSNKGMNERDPFFKGKLTQFLNNDENYRRLSAQMEMPPQDQTIFSDEKISDSDRLDDIEKRLDKLEGKTSGIIHIPTLLEIKQYS